MAENKAVKLIRQGILDKATLAHKGFVECVFGLVEKHTPEKVLTDPDLKWLLKQYERVVEFSEQYQLKTIPSKIEHGVDNDNAYNLKLLEKMGILKDSDESKDATSN